MYLMRRALCLACALALIAGCGGKKGEPEDESDDSATALDLLPDEGDLAGWRLVEPGKLYVGEELCDPINGAAEKYFQFGFKEAAFGMYAKGEGLLEVQIYEMGSPDDACGIYSVYDDVNATHGFIAVPSPGLSEATGPLARTSEGRYEFAAGSHYVRVLSHGNEPGRSAAALFAVQVASSLFKSGISEPPVAAFLPVGWKSGGTKYFRTAATQADVFYISDENVFSLGKATFGVSACYDVKTTEAGTKVGVNALFVMEYPTAEAALDAFEAAQEHLASEAYRVFGVPEGPEPKLIVLKGDAEFLKLNRCRNVLYGAWNIVDAERVNTLMKQLEQHVRERTNTGTDR